MCHIWRMTKEQIRHLIATKIMGWHKGKAKRKLGWHWKHYSAEATIDNKRWTFGEWKPDVDSGSAQALLDRIVSNLSEFESIIITHPQPGLFIAELTNRCGLVASCGGRDLRAAVFQLGFEMAYCKINKNSFKGLLKRHFNMKKCGAPVNQHLPMNAAIAALGASAARIPKSQRTCIKVGTKAK